MERTFKRGLSLIIAVLFLFSGFGNSFLIRAEEEETVETVEETGIMLLSGTDTYTFNGLTFTTNDGSDLTSATAAGTTDLYVVSNVVYVNTSKPLTVSGTTTTTAIAIVAGVKADLTFAGVSITNISVSPVNIMPNTVADQTVLHLTLADGTINTLNASAGTNNAGLHVSYGGALVIDDSVRNPVGVYGGRLTENCTINGEDLKAGDPAWKMDSANPGKLNVYGGQNGADIGGNHNENSGAITINGGNITVNAYTNGGSNSAGAGIGGGYYGGTGCSLDGGGVVINGGIINATASYHGAAIGAGWSATAAGVGHNGKIPGDITINGGYITATGKDHGNAFGGACGSQANVGHGTTTAPHEITITGGTLLPKSNNNGTQWDVGANGGKVIVTGGSFFPAKYASSSTGYSIQGAQVVSSDGTSLTMVTIDLSSYTYKDATGADKSLEAGDYLYSYNVTVDGVPVSPEYGLSTKLDGTKKLYFWLPASSKGKSVSISNVILQTADGTKVDTSYPFTLEEVGGSGGDVTKRYVTFEVDESEFSNELKALINKRYDGLSFDWHLLNEEIIRQEVVVPQPVGGKISDINQLEESAVRLLDASGNSTGEGSSKDEFYQAGSYTITVNYKGYASDADFSKTFWGHQTTLNSTITPADTVIFNASYDATFYTDSEGKNQVDELILSASVRPKNGEALTCAAPDGYIQFYINGVRVGAPQKVTAAQTRMMKAKAATAKVEDSNGYAYSTANITLKFKDNQDYPKVPDLSAFDENTDERFVVTAKYYDGTNYTNSEGRVLPVAEEEEEPENFPYVNPPIAVVTPVDPTEVDPDEPIDGDPKKPAEIKIEEDNGKDILHSYVEDRLNAKVEEGKVRDKAELMEMMNHRYGFTNSNNTVLMVGNKAVVIDDITIVNGNGKQVNEIDMSNEGNYQISTTVKDGFGNKTTITLNYGVKDITKEPDGDDEKELIPDLDTDGDGFPDINVDTDGDGEPDTDIDTDKDGLPDVNVDTDGDGKPDVNIDKDGDGEPDLNIVDKDGDGKPDNIDPNDPDQDKKPNLNIVDKDGDGEPDDLDDLTKEELKETEPDVNIDTDKDGLPDVNVDTDGDGKPDVNIDKDGDGEPDLNIVDKDGDGKPDNIDPNDPDQDKKPNLNIVDKDGDGEPDDLDDLTKEELKETEPDVNIDTDKDGKPDVNVDTDDDGKPDVNIDKDGDKEPDLNIVDKDGDGKPDNIDPKDPNQDKKPNVNIVDKDGDGKPDDLNDLTKEELSKVTPDVNIDTTGDGKADLNVDKDGDGKPDINIDTDGDGIADKNIDLNGDGIVDVTVVAPVVDTRDETHPFFLMLMMAMTLGAMLLIKSRKAHQI